MIAVILTVLVFAIAAAFASFYPGRSLSDVGIDDLPGLDAHRAEQASLLAEAQRFSARADAQGPYDPAFFDAPATESTPPAEA